MKKYARLVFFSLYQLLFPKRQARMELDLYSASLMLMLRAKCHYYSDEAMYDYVMHHLYNHVPGKQIDRALDGIHLRDYLQTLYQETIKKH